MKKSIKAAFLSVIAASAFTGLVSCSDDSGSDSVTINYAVLPDSIGENELKGRTFGSSSGGSTSNVVSRTPVSTGTSSMTFAFKDNGQVLVTGTDGSKIWYNYSWDSESETKKIYLAAAKICSADGTETMTVEEAVSELKSEVSMTKSSFSSGEMKNYMISTMVSSYQQANPEATSDEIAKIKKQYETLYPGLIKFMTSTLDNQLSSIIAVAENVTTYSYYLDEKAGTITLTQIINSDTDLQAIPYLYEISYTKEMKDYSVNFNGTTLTLTDNSTEKSALYYGVFSGNKITYTQVFATGSTPETSLPSVLNATSSFEPGTINFYEIIFNDENKPLSGSSYSIGITVNSYTLTETN